MLLYRTSGDAEFLADLLGIFASRGMGQDLNLTRSESEC